MQKLTSKKLSDLLENAKKTLFKEVESKEVPIEKIWAMVVGEKIAQMTRVLSFYNGILVVNVQSSTLSGLLSRVEKPKILNKLKKDFAFLKVKSLVFKTG